MPKTAAPRKAPGGAADSSTTSSGALNGAGAASGSNAAVDGAAHAGAHSGRGAVVQQDMEIFVDPMMGGPLPMFVERDVVDAGKLIEDIMKHGGQVSSGYSNVNYIIVNANTESGRNLARQYAGKKGKVVLASEWIKECIRRGELLTFKSDWAGCRLDGFEHNDRPQTAANILSSVPRTAEAPTDAAPRGKKRPRPSSSEVPPPALSAAGAPGTLHAHQQPHASPSLATATAAYPMTVSQLSQAPAHIAWNIPPQPPAHLVPPPPPALQRLPSYGTAPGMPPPPPPPGTIQPAALRPWETGFPPPPAPAYGFHYPGAEHWDENAAAAYYQHPFQPPPPPSSYTPDEPYVGQFTTPPSDAPSDSAVAAAAGGGEERGRPLHRPSRTSTSRQSIAQAGAPRTFRKPLARSPTPPTRIMKSTFGGNLFTSEDILYLKKYIDYCQQQGLILSLREICERLAIRAPHHTFYSWRRFCNKHQIKLGAYDMSVFKASVDGVGEGRAGGGGQGEEARPLGMSVGLGGAVGLGEDGLLGADEEEEEDEEVRNAILGTSAGGAGTGLGVAIGAGLASPTAHTGRRTVQAPAAAGFLPPSHHPHPAQPEEDRDRSPTPPRTLYRSTTGKGVAFTEEDVTYLLRYLQWAQGQDMVQVWRDIAQKAPHHSRASWMKYWRRHKHEFDADRPPTLPQAGPDEPAMKRRRYDREDDVKLARLVASKPQGTSDQIFQLFAKERGNEHHPWKGWQEHARIHKARIDHIVKEIEAGVFEE